MAKKSIAQLKKEIEEEKKKRTRLNKKIKDLEERKKLQAQLKSLKKKPVTQAQQAKRKKTAAKARRIAGGIKSALDRAAADF